MAGLGHEDAFPRPRLSGRCRFSQGTFAGVHGNGRNAPKAAIYIRGIDLAGPTRSCRSPPVKHGTPVSDDAFQFVVL
jgi:hypothetical protein